MDREHFVPKVRTFFLFSNEETGKIYTTRISQTVNPTFQLDSKLQSIQEFMIQQEEKLGSGEDMKILQGT